MRGESSIDILPAVQKRRSLEAYARLEHSVSIVPSDGTLNCSWKVGLFSQSIDIYGVKPITAIIKTLDLIGLIFVGLGCEVPGISCRVDNSGGLHARGVSADPPNTTQDLQ